MDRCVAEVHPIRSFAPLTLQPWECNPGSATLGVQPWECNPGSATLGVACRSSPGAGAAKIERVRQIVRQEHVDGGGNDQWVGWGRG